MTVLRYSCIVCDGDLESPESLLDGSEACPHCGFVNIVPSPEMMAFYASPGSLAKTFNGTPDYSGLALQILKNGHNPLRAQQHWARAALEAYKATGVVKAVKAMISADSCRACRARSKKKYGLEEALRLLPIPRRDCTFKLYPDDRFAWCRCDFEAIL